MMSDSSIETLLTALKATKDLVSRFLKPKRDSETQEFSGEIMGQVLEFQSGLFDVRDQLLASKTKSGISRRSYHACNSDRSAFRCSIMRS